MKAQRREKKKSEELGKFSNLIVHMNIYFNEMPEPQTLDKLCCP